MIGIVGFGIIGAYIAWKLKQNGFNSTVFEANNSSKKLCSGLISDRIWDFIPKNENLVERMFDEETVHFRKKTITLKTKRKMLLFDRNKLNNYVSGLAENEGVKVNYNSKIKEVLPDKNLVLVDKEYMRFDKLIGCDGALSVVRKSLKLKDPEFRLGIVTYVKGDEYSIETWATDNGFFWKIPTNRGIEYGMIEKPEVAKKMFDDFCSKFSIKPKKIEAALIPNGLRVGNSNIALCGDAAGLTKKYSGGGVIWGLTAADFLINNFPDFDKYNRKVKGFFMPQFLRVNIMNGLAYRFGNLGLVPSKIKFDPDFGI